MGIEGKHVVVTGSTGGLGGAVVSEFLRLGAHCHLPVRTGGPTPTDSAPSDRVHVASGIDLTDDDMVRDYFAQLPELWASIHLVGGYAMAAVADTSAADLRRMFALNVETAFLTSREAIRCMQRSSGGGRIVNIAARPAVRPATGMVAYATAKAAVASLTECLAEEMRSQSILINAVLPSIIDTPANRSAMPDADFDTWPKPEQIAKVIAFLASPDNELATGLLVPLYGRA